jgi:hypothetical protein
MRLAPVNLAGQLLDFSTSEDLTFNDYTLAPNGTASPFMPGTYLHAAPTDRYISTANVPNWGACELLYVVNVSTAIVPGTMVTVDKNFNVAATAAAASVTSGIPLFVALTNFAAGSTTPQGGWVLRSGIAPVRFSVAATAGAVYLGTAGLLTPTAAAGVQLLNASTLIAASGSFTRAVSTSSGSTRVRISSAAGLYPGIAISGTGIPGSTTVSSIDQSGRYLTLSAAATATGTVTGTFTHTGYGIVQLDRSFKQGQIT